MLIENCFNYHSVKSVRIWSYSGPHFPAFGLTLRISPYSVQMQENVDQNNSKYGHFLRNVFVIGHVISLKICWRDITAYFIYLGLFISSLLRKVKIKERVKQSQKCENLVQVSSVKYCLANLFPYRVCFTSVLKI